MPNLKNTMMELRKCCIHPYLIRGAEERIIHESHAESPEAMFELMIRSSGKLVLIDKLLPRLQAGGHKILIFSQMTRYVQFFFWHPRCKCRESC
jgi:SNF2 family DNA or RNA helicase